MKKVSTFFPIFIALTVLLSFSIALAQGAVKTTATVYRDGWVHVKVEATIDPTEPSATLQLLSSSVNNVLVTDEGGEPLAYDLKRTNITIYTLGASKAVLEYDTIALTSMTAGVWTISFTSPYPLMLILPENATIMYFNAPPSSIKSESTGKGSRLVLELSPGSWEISYVLEAPIISPPQGGAQPPQQQPSPPSPQPSQPSQPSEARPPSPSILLPNALMLAVGAIVVAIALSLVLLKRRGGIARAVNRAACSEALDGDEVKVVELLRGKGGRALEAEIREALGLPKTTAWRLVRRLEKKGLVVVRKVGSQNAVELRVSS
ncbi:MAG: winged helix-turn-helix transcriptional regulator [Thaumarchaeota archaeon]|jgi:uncharacterized membrane protein|nr:winged helix-turn-helix transcriptional regulator [Nitrososphaerota archaeon]